MLIRKPRLRQLKDLTWKEFVGSHLFSNVYTWPYCPAGTLKHPCAPVPDSRESTEVIIRIQNQEFNEAERFVESFSEKQKSVLGWIFAAAIGVIGNLVVNLAFSTPSTNIDASLLLLFMIVLVVLVTSYLMFLPRVSVLFRFIPNYKSFLNGYETHIPSGSCRKRTLRARARDTRAKYGHLRVWPSNPRPRTRPDFWERGDASSFPDNPLRVLINGSWTK